MGVQAVLNLVAVSLITAGSQQISSAQTGVNETGNSSLPTRSTSTSTNCACPTTASPRARPTHPQLALLKVRWSGQCKGDVELFSHQHPSSTPVCYKSNVSGLLETLCQQKRGCKGPPHWLPGEEKEHSYYIQETGIEQQQDLCPSLRVHCSAEAAGGDVQGQLRTYKVMTALLCCVLLLLLMIRFAKPTVKALQKRFSDRRQNRWIGPTQSHSVSYHRDAVKSIDREKRLSYPALERLTVIDSREPSSNRNSDCNY